MDITSTQMPEYLRNVIQEQIDIYNNGRSITVYNEIPDTTQIPIENQRLWLKIPDIICVFVDIQGSTKLSATKHDKGTAGVYQLFTNTTVRIFHEMEAPYIDVKGDGVFALFNSNQIYRALVSAVSFKTFAEIEFIPRIRQVTEIDIGCHIGIDQKTVLVRKVGLKRKNGRTDRQNEVWAGKPVNMASKLASMSKNKQLFVSDRYFNKLKDNKAIYSCGCPNNEVVKLWKDVNISDKEYFDFNTAYYLESHWCPTHGVEYMNHLLSLDK
jgi:class 3 adenylate cyclase